MGRRLVARLCQHTRKATLAALTALALLTSATLLAASTVVSPTFTRSAAYPTTPNGRFPQETAQIVQLKQFKKLKQADIAAGNPVKPDIDYRRIAGAGVGLSAFAMIGLGESAAEQSQLLTVAGSGLSTAGTIMCMTGYGCAFGGPLAVVGGLVAVAGQTICLVQDCTISVRSNGTVDDTDIEGDAVRNIKPKVTADPGGPYPQLSENGGEESPTAFKALITKYGFNREFIAQDGQGRYRKAIILGYNKASGYLMRSSFGDYVDTNSSHGPTWPRDTIPMIPCSFTSAPGGACSPYRYAAIGTNTACTPYNSCVLFLNSFAAATSNQNVLTEYVPVQKVPFLAVGTGSQLPPEKAAAIVHPSIMANVANAVWKAQGAAAPVPYDASDPITDKDVQDYRNAYPDRASNLADMARPMNAPGQPPKIGPIDEPVNPPAQVEVVNPSANPAATPSETGNTGTEKNDEELDGSDGLLGDIMEPARDFFSGPFKKFMTPGITLPATASTCPVFAIDIPTLMGRRDKSAPQSSEFLCDWYNKQRPLFLGFEREALTAYDCVRQVIERPQQLLQIVRRERDDAFVIERLHAASSSISRRASFRSRRSRLASSTLNSMSSRLASVSSRSPMARAAGTSIRMN